MKAFQKISATAALLILAMVSLGGGCSLCEKTPTPPLGAQSDDTWRRQAAGGSASDFVVYQHEFVTDTDDIRLNMAGEDHLRSIAARLHCGAPLPVIVERSMTSKRPGSEFQYPINPNPELDMKRREYVVKSLVALGITNADQCVVVAPAMAEGYSSTAAAQAYERGMTAWGRGYGGFGGSTAGGLGGIGVGGNIR